ncbi:hypothetical protein EYR38_007297 [Pleurotus pulmonarius]|nr:hypothetical protein EYR38_007297 [Pleurotus pulmonarius]
MALGYDKTKAAPSQPIASRKMIQIDLQSPSSILVAEDSAIAPSVDGGNILIVDGNDEQKDTNEAGHVGDVFNDGDDLSALSVSGLLGRLFKDVEAVRREEKPAVPTWCIIA